MSDISRNRRKDGFVCGITYIEFSLAAIWLVHPICVINAENGKEYTFLLNGKKIGRIIECDGIKNLFMSARFMVIRLLCLHWVS